MSQTSYSINHSPAYAGGRADSSDYYAASAYNKDAVEIPFGTFVSLGTVVSTIGPQDVLPAKLPTASGDTYLGVAMHDMTHQHTYPFATGTPVQGASVGQTFAIMRRGRVYVTSETAMNPGSPVFVRFASGAGGTVKGVIRSDADTATAVQIPNAIVVGKCAAAGIVAIEVNLP